MALAHSTYKALRIAGKTAETAMEEIKEAAKVAGPKAQLFIDTVLADFRQNRPSNGSGVCWSRFCHSLGTAGGPFLCYSAGSAGVKNDSGRR